MSITPLMPVYPRCAMRPVRGEGAYLIGERGERYLDFASGIAVNLLGHGHPHLTKAIQEQAATLMHVEEGGDRLALCRGQARQRDREDRGEEDEREQRVVGCRGDRVGRHDRAEEGRGR